ncbi:PREDICTED: DNA mismatch repair protein MSH7 isoform X2 [Populus euphratica]|uniref:DNA mismatch repair protein MSH7 isoform X2 n=1 Tax=Populus euphratica TaxID=75702 RepID=A0AAJ6TK05_POPEU|nr:PREDICTED: DNA mismatch repair protein MSH7 isoform X2 [Populus euphratica]
MPRQKSILSFFQKPSLPSQSSYAGERTDGLQAPLFSAKQHNQNVSQPVIHGLVDSSIEIRGTDTPPEKVPRQILPVNIKENEEVKVASLFSSIMHKFVKVDDREKPNGRNEVHSANVCSTSVTFTIPKELPQQGMDPLYSEKDNGFSSSGMVDQTSVLNIESVNDFPGPHTPGMRPLVPRLKRILEDVPKFEDKNGCSLLNSSKRVKPLQDSASLIKNHEEISNSTSKFEWLDPAQIRDANGRRPNDPLYDKKTLYLPPDALKKMSASQKQYWTVKSQYMDVLLFFKVGKFYELYELDAEIGHTELDWKMTLSGVGKCRQVGISESGIDDAVEKLVARGYKVGRVEQLETSDQAKSRGANSVIQRKLVQVVTPSTTTDHNMGPDAVHLLAIKEGNYGVDNGATAYGFAFVDCAALRVWVGSINDDASHAALGALLMQISPKEVIYENRELSRGAQKELRKYSLIGSTALQLSPVLPGTDFVDASEVKNLIQSKDYFKWSTNPWNHALDSIMHQDISLCALGGLIGHLSRLMFDDVLRNADILPYQVYKGCLRMDGQTLVNLEIFSNSADGGSSGTLFNYLDNCVTSSGKRLLRNWICHPLKHVEGINNRLDVIENLTARSEIMLVIAQYLRKLPDLERMLGRVKVSFQASGSLALPLISKKLLKQRGVTIQQVSS